MRQPRRLAALFDESLTVVYRVLFLMFAEARGLVPNWHPSLPGELHHRIAARSHRAAGRRSAACGKRFRRLRGSHIGVAMRAHSSCRRSTAACSRHRARRSPNRAPLTMRSRARRCSRCRPRRCGSQDSDANRLSRSRRRAARCRLRERAGLRARLRDERRHQGEILLRRGGDRRKSTGSFYTPQSLTDYVVRRTLHPLVAERACRAHPPASRSSIRRWAARRFWCRPAVISRVPTSGR